MAGLPSTRCVRPGVAGTCPRAETTARSGLLGFSFSLVKGGERRAGMSHLNFAEAGIVGLLQGITELFPVSSLGHAVLIPAIVGGQWAADLNVSRPESPYLAYIVGLHVATATAMIIFFWRDLVPVIRGVFRPPRPVV